MGKEDQLVYWLFAVLIASTNSKSHKAEAQQNYCSATIVIIGSSSTGDIRTSDHLFEILSCFSDAAVDVSGTQPKITIPFVTDAESNAFHDYTSVLVSACGIVVVADDTGISTDKFRPWLQLIHRVFVLHKRAQVHILVSSPERQQLALDVFMKHDDVVVGVSCSHRSPEGGFTIHRSTEKLLAAECECIRRRSIRTASKPLLNQVFAVTSKHKPAGVILPNATNNDRDAGLQDGRADVCKRLNKIRCGFVIDFLDVISPFVNATFDIRPAPPDMVTGTVFANGSATGMFHDIVDGKDDLLAGFFYLNEWRVQALDVVTLDKECTVIAAPYRRREVKKFSVLLAPFSTFVWLTLIGAGFVLTMATFAQSNENAGSRKSQRRLRFWARYGHASMYALQALSGQGMEPKAMRNLSQKQRLLFLVGSSASVVLTTAYLGQVTSLITLPQMNSPITTLSDLKASGLPIKIGDYEGYWDYLFAPDGMLAEFNTKLDKMKVTPYYGLPFVARGEAAFIESGSEMQAQKQRLAEEIKGTGGYAFEIRELEVCLELNWPGIVVAKHTRYGTALANYALRARQLGIMKKIKARYESREIPLEITEEKHDLGAFSEVFIAYSILLAACIIVFCLEVLIGGRQKKVNGEANERK